MGSTYDTKEKAYLLTSLLSFLLVGTRHGHYLVNQEDHGTDQLPREASQILPEILQEAQGQEEQQQRPTTSSQRGSSTGVYLQPAASRTTAAEPTALRVSDRLHRAPNLPTAVNAKRQSHHAIIASFEICRPQELQASSLGLDDRYGAPRCCTHQRFAPGKLTNVYQQQHQTAWQQPRHNRQLTRFPLPYPLLA